MKVVDKLVVISIVKTALITILLCAMMLVSVQLFANLDALLRNEVPFFPILKLAVLSIPTAVIYSLAPSLLFASSFTFSQLSANNEMICLYNATISRKRLVLPVIILGIAFSLFQLAFSEYIGVPAERERSILEADLIGVTSSRDSRNITLSDWETGSVFHARYYSDREKRAQYVTLIRLGDDMKILRRVDSPAVIWNEEKGNWDFLDATITVPGEGKIEKREEKLWREEDINLKSDVLRDNSSDIATMTIPVALEFLSRIGKLDRTLAQSYAVDFARRILSCLTPLVMLFISCTITYKFKKNVLLFTIIQSIAIAVIYYVVQMVTLIFSRQGVLSPLWGMSIPMIVIVCIAELERLIFRGNA